jgi:dye decolorizing peroxidase
VADRGGDVMVQLCASDPLLLPGAAAAIASVTGLRERWRQAAFRGPNVPIGAQGSAPRNLLGFVDGIVVPRGDAEYARDVWLPSGTPVAGGTIAVVRRMEIDVDRFLAQAVADQERIIGRRRESAAPLSGGAAATNPDLGAKTPSGAYVIPADAHLRRANPVSTGVPTMLRRSYSFADTASGLLFVSFQNDLRTFVATLNRMSNSDALLDYTTTTRSGTFLVLPGFDRGRPLGSGLFDS